MLRKTPYLKYLCGIVALLMTLQAKAQQTNAAGAKAGTAKQLDVIDIISKILKIKGGDDTRDKAGKASFSIVPNVGYSLTTGALVDISGNVGFYTTPDHAHQSLSDLDEDLNFDSKAQKVALLRGEIWGPNNDYKFAV